MLYQRGEDSVEIHAPTNALCYRNEKLSIVNKFFSASDIKAVTRVMSHTTKQAKFHGREKMKTGWDVGQLVTPLRLMRAPGWDMVLPATLHPFRSHPVPLLTITPFTLSPDL